MRPSCFETECGLPIIWQEK